MRKVTRTDRSGGKRARFLTPVQRSGASTPAQVTGWVTDWGFGVCAGGTGCGGQDAPGLRAHRVGGDHSPCALPVPGVSRFLPEAGADSIWQGIDSGRKTDSVRVLKDPQLLAAYGAEGRPGVVLIFLREGTRQEEEVDGPGSVRVH
jgi:hypothetical protein